MSNRDKTFLPGEKKKREKGKEKNFKNEKKREKGQFYTMSNRDKTKEKRKI